MSLITSDFFNYYGHGLHGWSGLVKLLTPYCNDQRSMTMGVFREVFPDAEYLLKVFIPQKLKKDIGYSV